MLKMPASNDQGYDIISYLNVRSRYTYLPYFPKSPQED